MTKKRAKSDTASIPPGPPTWASSPEAVTDLAAAFRPGAAIVAKDGARLVAELQPAGVLRTSTKQVVGLDPLAWPFGLQWKTAATPGAYPVFVSLLRDPASGRSRVAAAAIVLSSAPVARWKTLPQRAVDSGFLAFGDAGAAERLSAFGAEYDVIDAVLLRAAEVPLHVVAPLDARAKRNLVVIRVGDPASCVGYQALAADKTPVALVVGLGVLPGDGAEGDRIDAATLLGSWIDALDHHPAPHTRYGRFGQLDADVELRVESSGAVETITGRTEALAGLTRHGIAYLHKHGPISSRSTDVAEVAFEWRGAPGESAGTLRVEADGRRLRRVHVEVRRPPPRTIVPDVVGQWWQKAIEALREARLEFTRGKSEANRAPADTVLRQAPPPGADVLCGFPVSVDISTGPSEDGFTLPTLDGLTLAQAEGRLSLVGLVRGEVTVVPAAGAKPGTVLSSAPPGGSQVERGARVDLTVTPP